MKIDILRNQIVNYGDVEFAVFTFKYCFKPCKSYVENSTCLWVLVCARGRYILFPCAWASRFTASLDTVLEFLFFQIFIYFILLIADDIRNGFNESVILYKHTKWCLWFLKLLVMKYVYDLRWIYKNFYLKIDEFTLKSFCFN